MIRSNLPLDSPRLMLYAVVPRVRAGDVNIALSGVRLIDCSSFSAVAEALHGNSGTVRAAKRHDSAVRCAVRQCASVVPFRHGLVFVSESELRSTVAVNAPEIDSMLERVRNRVEMGLRVMLPGNTGQAALAARRGATTSADGVLLLDACLGPVRSLAEVPADRLERLSRTQQGIAFHGCYLISRRAVGQFWDMVEGLRTAMSGAAILGSGPWAAYSFCIEALRRPACSHPRAGDRYHPREAR